MGSSEKFSSTKAILSDSFSMTPLFLNHISLSLSLRSFSTFTYPKNPNFVLINVATARRLQSDSGAFADWVASSSASAGDLSLGFNAEPAAPAAAAGMWPSASTRLPPEFFFVAPASSFHHHHNTDAAAAINFDPHSLNPSNAIGVGVIPLLTAVGGSGGGSAADEDLFSRSRGGGGGGSGMQLWQHHHQQGQNSSAYLIKPMALEHPNLLPSSGGGGGGASSSSSACQDCGNQAKKDCQHRRCRTCCKSRGYDCTTHFKSTWVPAARRRERQLLATAGSSQSTSGTKKPRLGAASQTTTASHTSTSNTNQARSFDTSSSHQDAGLRESLPGQVRAQAVFKCVRVTAVDDGEDEYAYQAVVKIGGHVFKGFLYDQGVEGREGLPNLSELHLGGGGGNGASSSPPVNLDHASNIYGGASFLGGSNYGNPIN